MAKMVADGQWESRYFNRHMPTPPGILEEVNQKIQKSWQSQPIEPRSVLGRVSADQLRGPAQKRPRGRRRPPRGDSLAPMSYRYQSCGPGFHSSPPHDERQYGYQSTRLDDRGYKPQPYAGPPQYGAPRGPPPYYSNQYGPPLQSGDQRGPPPVREYSPPRGLSNRPPSRGCSRSRGRQHNQHGSGHFDERRGRSRDHHGDRSHRRDPFGSPHFRKGSGHEGSQSRGETSRERGYFANVQTPSQPKTSAVQWRTEFKESDTGLIASHVRERGMACIRHGDGTYYYKFERNRASNSGAEADNDEDGSSVVLGINREEIIENINKNPTMTRTEKRLTRANVPLSPEDPYSSEGVHSEEGLKFINTTLVQGEQQETLENLENQLPKDLQTRKEGKAVATSGPAEEDNAVAMSDPTTMQAEAVADPEHKDDQASTAVAVGPSSAKPAMGLGSATSSLTTNELTCVIDTGATSHMCKDIGLFVTFEPLESSMGLLPTHYAFSEKERCASR
ncbi:unnamed protein product [Phytophthora fragariaefolia]|uniref:Unnamed protein product n=1 Tax=Phytophthora fragariaefolia TaxID=1490495 RepID=A0A9W6Y895_9STRA|nr:unnamed protein product [Phytophthora fragariaefolia]